MNELEIIEKKYHIGFPQTEDPLLKNLVFSFERENNAKMFARGINEFQKTRMEQLEYRNEKDYINRGVHIANSLNIIGCISAKAYFLNAQNNKKRGRSHE